jgi:hypothetical protein
MSARHDFQDAFEAERFQEFATDPDQPCMACGELPAPIVHAWVLPPKVNAVLRLPQDRPCILGVRFCKRCDREAKRGNRAVRNRVVRAIRAAMTRSGR